MGYQLAFQNQSKVCGNSEMGLQDADYATIPLEDPMREATRYLYTEMNRVENFEDQGVEFRYEVDVEDLQGH